MMSKEKAKMLKKHLSGISLYPEKKELHKKHISNKHLCLGAAILAAAFVFTMPDIHAKAAERTEDGLVLVEGGTFTMGSPRTERLRGKDETSHEVTVNDFYAAPYEVTQKEYKAVMGKNPSRHKGSDKPVENVTWYDAVNFCNKLSKKNHLKPVYKVKGRTVTWNRNANGYRLLTEAEWEYAARAGKKGIFYTGSQINSDEANYYGYYPYLIEENYENNTNPDVVEGDYRGTTVKVSSFAPNAYGLYNMHGNVSEWCFDYYSAYNVKQKKNPAGPKSGTLRVNRGGGYNDYAKHLRFAYRSVADPESADQNLGFRIARNKKGIRSEFTTKKSFTVKQKKNPKVLIAYFSDSGNTRHAAELLQKKTGADLVEIEMENPYSDDLYHEAQVDLYAEKRPKLKTEVSDMAQYDVILLGFPNWWATAPMPVFSFVESYNLNKKMIYPFVSHGSGIYGESISDLSKTLSGTYIGEGFEFEYGGGSRISSNLSKWLKRNKITK